MLRPMRLLRAWLVTMFGCGATPRTCPPAVATVAELHAAREYGARAIATSVPSRSRPHVWDQPYGGRTWYPWFYYWDPDLEHARLTAAGINGIQAIEIEHRAACAGIGRRAQAASPLDSYAIESTRVRDGVILHLERDAGPPESLLVGLRCHRAWLRMAPRPGAGEDVLAIDRVKLVVHAGARDGIDLLFSSDAGAVLDEVERRAGVAVARATRLRAMQSRE